MRHCGWLLGLTALTWPAWGATVEWDRTPIPVDLYVGVEQQVRFEGPATVGAPSDLVESGAFRTLFVNDTAYWLARRAFGERRIKVRLNEAGEFVLFDVHARDERVAGDWVEPIEVVVSRPADGAAAGAPAAAGEAAAGFEVRERLVELIRYAAQVEAGPARLVAGFRGISEVSTAVRDVTGLYRHEDAARLRLRATRQWTGGGLYVTVVQAANGAEQPVAVDVRHLSHAAGGVTANGVSRGLIAVGMVGADPVLAPRGAEGSVRRLYVVTREPFDATVRVE